MGFSGFGAWAFCGGVSRCRAQWALAVEQGTWAQQLLLAALVAPWCVQSSQAGD